MPAAVDDPAGECDESGADGARDGELIVGMDVAETDRPADEVVSEDRAREPRRVGEELSGRAVLETSAFFEVTDREFNGGVIAVELIAGDGIVGEVGRECGGPPGGIEQEPPLSRLMSRPEMRAAETRRMRHHSIEPLLETRATEWQSLMKA